MDNKSRIKLFTIIMVSVCLLLGAAIRMSFWEDETYTATQSQKPFSDLVQSMQFDVHPVLPIIVTSIWGSIFGYNEIGLRSLSILLSAANLLLTFFLAKDLFDQSTALTATILLAFSPLFILFGYQARYYSIAMLFTLGLVIFLRFYLKTQRPIYLIFYTVTGGLLTLISYSAFSVIIAANLWWVIDWLRRKPGKPTTLLYWIIAQVGILLFYLPSISHVDSLIERYYGIPELGNWITEILKRALYLAFTYAVGQTTSPLNPIAWIGSALVAFLVIYAIIKRRDQTSLWFVVVFLGVIVGANLGISFMSGWLSQIWQNLPHWSFYALPFWAILLAAGVSKLRMKSSAIVIAVLLLVYGTGILNLYSGKQFLQPIYATPWKEIFKNISENSSASMALVCSGSDVSCKYYANRFGFSEDLYPEGKNIPVDQIDQVWWIQIYMGQERTGSGNEEDALDRLESVYSVHDTFPYSRQDESLRWLKKTFLGQEDYEFRVVVYRFSNP
ncbi:MAG TPA: glycosyltransferase family 39 protein [Anaerolineales bacterium]|nr:glycosyltransferase family 39 protein [Anaerolineales bacterium]